MTNEENLCRNCLTYESNYPYKLCWSCYHKEQTRCLYEHDDRNNDDDPGDCTDSRNERDYPLTVNKSKAANKPIRLRVATKKILDRASEESIELRVTDSETGREIDMVSRVLIDLQANESPKAVIWVVDPALDADLATNALFESTTGCA